MQKLGDTWENDGKSLKNSPTCRQSLQDALCSHHGQYKSALYPTCESEKFTV